MFHQRGFLGLSPILIASILGAALLAALAVQSWRLGAAQTALGAYQARTAQLEADVDAATATLADERAESARIDALLSRAAAEAAHARRRAATADARYRDALRQDIAAASWAAARMPDAAIARLCDDAAGGDEGRAGAGAAAVCAAR